MYYFFLAPINYQNYLFVSINFSQTRCKILIEYYIEKNNHLIPKNIEIIEYFEENKYYCSYKYDNEINIYE